MEEKSYPFLNATTASFSKIISHQIDEKEFNKIHLTSYVTTIPYFQKISSLLDSAAKYDFIDEYEYFE